MNNPAPNIRIPVDLTNPGQFFACCGLLELADRLWRGAEGWFERSMFCILTEDRFKSFAELLCETRLLHFEVGDDSDAEDEADEADDKGSPIEPIRLQWKSKKPAIDLDWWSEKAIKPWAGSMKERVILRAMLTAIDPTKNDPFNDLRRVQYQSPKLTKGGKPSKPKKKEPFYFDSRRGNKSHPLDCGFSPDTHHMEAECCPALEALCFIGLQRARPAPTGVANQSKYTAWPRISATDPGIPANLVGAVTCGFVPVPGSSTFIFDNYFRTDQRKHKTFPKLRSKGAVMSDPKVDFSAFDKFLDPNGPVIISLQQKLKVAAISGDDIVFPPSYAPTAKKKDADDKGAKKDKDAEKDSVYNIDMLDPLNPAKNVCVLDSIPSQANRLEPIFASDEYKELVPQYQVKLTEDVDPVSILAVGHRLADAVFRGTTLRQEIVEAFKKYAKGDAAGIARLGPTSLVFGVWDSRGTGVKIPRIINSIVRAFDVVSLRRSARYTPPIKYKQEGLLPPGLDIDPAEHGLADVPSPLKIGGVQVNGEIRRDCSLNLEIIRSLKGKDATGKDISQELRRYVLGLAFIALIATSPATLRQGCTLIPQIDSDNPHKPDSELGKAWKPRVWKMFYADGKTASWDPTNLDIKKHAKDAAAAFVVNPPSSPVLEFKPALLKVSIEADSKSKADKLAENAGDPVALLRGLVEAVVFDAKKDTFKETKPTKALRDRLSQILSDDKAIDELKAIATAVQELLTTDTGAQSRKEQMLAAFSAAPSAAPSTPEVPE